MRRGSTGLRNIERVHRRQRRGGAETRSAAPETRATGSARLALILSSGGRQSRRRPPTEERKSAGDRRRQARYGTAPSEIIGADFPPSARRNMNRDQFHRIRSRRIWCSGSRHCFRRQVPNLCRRAAATEREARQVHEYERNGVASQFIMFAPLEGWRRSISRRTLLPRSARPFPLPRRGASPSASNGVTRRSMETGST